VLKLWGMSYAGMPDRLVIGPYRVFFFIEFKTPRNPTATPLQKARHKMLRGFGFDVYIVRYSYEINDIVKTHKGPHNVA